MLALFSFVVLLLSALSVHTFPVSVKPFSGGRVCIDATYGVPVGNDVTRFVVKYANSSRWKPSTPVVVQQILSLVLKDLPPACPQSSSGPMSEDCLYMVVYVPNSINPGSNAPTLVWIHGGSFITGSASDPSIDGAKLALATQSIVAVTQYRLGGLGFMAPDGETNLAVNDIINALKFLKETVPMIGGSSSKITIAGQSSGATMVRALLATPSASSLFGSAILQSDPMDTGFLSTTTQQTMQKYFNGQFSCDLSNSSCASSLSVDDIVQASGALYSQAMYLDPAAGQGEPIRPVHDGQLITTTLTDNSPFPSVSKPILVTTVQDEAAPLIYTLFDSAVSEQLYQQSVTAYLGTSRANTLFSSERYTVQTRGGVCDARPTLEKMGTDYMWKCACWTFASTWASKGGPAYVGLYDVGSTYPSNSGIPFCTTDGAVCHQDDIQIVFGTASNPNAQQAQLIQEMQARYKAFLNTGNPNASGFAQWNAATSSSSNAILLGSSGPAPAGTCADNFWGGSVQFDYQVFDL